MEPNPDDAAIAEFHADARRRQVKIFGVASLLCLVIGIVVVIVALTAGDAIDDTDSYGYTTNRHSRRFEVKTIAAGIAFVVGGFGFGAKALAVRRGERVD